MNTSSEDQEIKLVDLIGCPDCGKSYLQKNIYRHLWDQHNWSRDDCRNLVQHIKNEKKVASETSTFTCTVCGIIFKTILEFLRHKSAKNCGMRDTVVKIDCEEEDDDEVEEKRDGIGFPIKYANANPFRRTATICPICSVRLDSCDELVTHCAMHHKTTDKKFEIEQKAFTKYADFKRWFDQRQEDSCTSLTKRTGHGGETFYRCHMVGKYSSVAKKRKSKPRKLDQSCTAFLKVFSYPDGSTYATGCFTHIGHELDHRLLWLTETQENYVIELIDQGFTSDQIYHYVRQEYENYECKLKYLSKNDIRNITVRHKRRTAGDDGRSSSEGVTSPKAHMKREVLETQEDGLNLDVHIKNENNPSTGSGSSESHDSTPEKEIKVEIDDTDNFENESR